MHLTSSRQSYHSRNEPLASAAPTNDEFYRLSTFTNAMEGLPGKILARRGFFYNEQTKEVECFSCGIRHRLRFDQYRDTSLVTHSDVCSFDNEGDSRNIPIVSSSSFRRISNLPTSSSRSYSNPHRAEASHLEVQRYSNESSLYPCDNPVYDRMQSLENRLATFIGNWPPSKTQCSTREIADAGFFYTGPDDEVLCWYCGGGLERWQYRDDPWLEHAKFHPECEYLLSRKGIDYVASIVVETPYVTRPTIRRRERFLPSSTQHINGGVFWQGFPFNNPSVNLNSFSEPNWERTDYNVVGSRRQTTYRAPGISVTTTRRIPDTSSSHQNTATSSQQSQDLVDIAMASSLTSEVMDMGFSREEIRSSVERRLEENGEMHESASELIEDILSSRTNGFQLSSSPQPVVWDNRNVTISTTSRLSLRDVPTIESSIDESRPRETSTTITQTRHPDNPSSLQEGWPSVDRESTSGQGLCCMCGDRPVKVLFMPCAHLVTCQTCGMNARQCPVCDNAVNRHIRVRTL